MLCNSHLSLTHDQQENQQHTPRYIVWLAMCTNLARTQAGTPSPTQA
jgi:hypothetical protein